MYSGTSFQQREASPGGRFQSQDSRTIHFGAGGATTVGLKITWPSGAVSSLPGLSVNQRVTVTEPTLPPPPPPHQEGIVAVPAMTEIFLARPNPFRDGTEIRFALARAGRPSLSVYDVSGRLVRSAGLGELPAGTHGWRWDGRDESGRTVANGIYFARFAVDTFRETERLVRVE